MDISFPPKLAKQVNSAALLKMRYGELAKQIRRRLDDLAALSQLSEANQIPGSFESLRGDRQGQFSLRLSGNWRLIFEAATDPIPLRQDGGIDLERVTAIRIIEIVDYH